MPPGPGCTKPPAPLSASSGPCGPDLHDTQRDALERLRRAGEVHSVGLVSVTLVTASVQALVEIREPCGRSYHAVIAPSGRIHRL
jgi:hypothetical protein